MPGRVTSIPNIGIPVTIEWLSTPLTFVPMIRKAVGVLSCTVARSGTGTVAAVSSNAVYLSLFPLALCTTTPGVVSHSDSGTFHVRAAAVTNIARAAAPTRRIGNQLVGVAVLPPADCPAGWPCGLKAASGPPSPIEYFASRSPCSTRTFFHSTSISSAISIGKVVFIPWPISGFFPTIVTMPSGVILMNAFGTKLAAGGLQVSSADKGSA